MKLQRAWSASRSRTLWVLAGIAVSLILYLALASQAADNGRTATVALGSLRKTAALNGTVWPKNRINVSPAVAGRIAEVLVEKGDLVREGDVLLRLDERSARIELQRRTFALERARVQYAERQSGSSDPPATGAAAIEIRQAEFELAVARRLVDDMVLRAPKGGRLVHLGVRRGDHVAPAGGTAGPALVIADTREFVVELEGDEYEIASIRTGQPAEVTVPALGSEPLTGTVVQGPVLKRFGSAMQASSVFGVTVGLAPLDVELQLGYGARVDIVLAEHRNVPVVPVGALFRHKGKDYLLAYSKEARVMRPVELRIVMTDDFIAEVAGVELGTVVSIADDGGAPPSFLKRAAAGDPK